MYTNFQLYLLSNSYQSIAQNLAEDVWSAVEKFWYPLPILTQNTEKTSDLPYWYIFPCTFCSKFCWYIIYFQFTKIETVTKIVNWTACILSAKISFSNSLLIPEIVLILQWKSPLHFVGQYLEKLKVFSVCPHVAYLCIRKFLRKNFPPKKRGAKLVTVINQPIARLPPTSYAYFETKIFFSSVIWTYRRLPIWLKFLNPARYKISILERLGSGMHLQNGNDPERSKKIKTFPHKMNKIVFIFS